MDVGLVVDNNAWVCDVSMAVVSLSCSAVIGFFGYEDGYVAGGRWVSLRFQLKVGGVIPR
jgi:hypothetical protein